MRLAVIIPAAGDSARFGAGDKLAQDLGGRPVLVRTVEIFAKRAEVVSIIVAGPPESSNSPSASTSDRLTEFRTRFGPVLGFHGAKIVPGGRLARWESVQNALAEVPEEVSHIAVHDAARPGLSDSLLSRLIEAAGALSAVVPVLPITSTVKRLSDTVASIDPVGDDARAESILGKAGRIAVKAQALGEAVDREGLVQIQTPQIFTADILRRAYAKKKHPGATDDASLVEIMGEIVYAVPGEPGNLKITTPEDLALLRAWISSPERKTRILAL